MKQIKIGFCGTHGSGKTTALLSLASYLKKLHIDVDVISEVARRCPYPINEDADLRTQIYIFAKMLENEVMPNSQILLCDRTLLDVFVYTYRVDKEIAKSLLPFIMKWVQSYDIIFFLSPKDYDINDGLRSTNKDFRNEIQQIFKELITSHNKPYYPLFGKIRFVESQEEINKIVKNHIQLKKIVKGFQESKLRF
jgi:thymidylate kinase